MVAYLLSFVFTFLYCAFSTKQSLLYKYLFSNVKIVKKGNYLKRLVTFLLMLECKKSQSKLKLDKMKLVKLS